MKTVLYKNKSIEPRKSDVHGWGVFTKEKISKGEILEECQLYSGYEERQQDPRSWDDTMVWFSFLKDAIKSWNKRWRPGTHDIEEFYKD